MKRGEGQKAQVFEREGAPDRLVGAEVEAALWDCWARRRACDAAPAALWRTAPEALGQAPPAARAIEAEIGRASDVAARALRRAA